MILFKLDSSHWPSTTIKNFESLAWTERYRQAGEFQLVIENDVSILQLLAKGSLISHSDTKEVMIVENHEISRDSKKVLKLTLSGRSFETFAERRVTYGSTLPIVIGATEELDVEQELIPEPATVLCHALLKSQLQPGPGGGTATAANAVPNLLVRTDIRVLDPDLQHIVKRGDIYSRVMDYLGLADAGIKNIRPNGLQTTMDMVIHDGADLINSVIFYAQYEDLDDAKYFSSIKNYNNYAQISTHNHARLYKSRNLVDDLTGLDRRIMYVEANDIVGPFPTPNANDVVSARAQSGLDEHQEISLMQATISKTANPKFKIDYDVGDLVTVFGEFSVAQIMRVIEHVLTVDKEGMRGFPSLSIM
jgi:Siphovirus ReqiPepy6 Gp37-like protein